MKKIFIQYSLIGFLFSSLLLISPTYVLAACANGMYQQTDGSCSIFPNGTPASATSQTDTSLPVPPIPPAGGDPSNTPEGGGSLPSGNVITPAGATVNPQTGAVVTPAPTAVNTSLTYTPLEPIPVVDQTGTANFGQLLSQVFKILLIIGALIAVGAFVFAGISYMVSEAVNMKSLAIKRLNSAFLGLLLLIGSWLILNTVNPQLVTFNGGLNPAQNTQFIQSAQTATQSSVVNGTMTAPDGNAAIYSAQNTPPTQTNAATAQQASQDNQMNASTCVTNLGGTIGSGDPGVPQGGCLQNSTAHVNGSTIYNQCANIPLSIAGHNEACFYNQL